MKKLLFVLVLGAFAACGGGDPTSTTDSTSTIVTADTSLSGAAMMSTDTMSTGSMRRDSIKTDTITTAH